MGRETKSPWLEERMGRDTKSPWLDNLMSEWVEKQNPLDRRERLPLLSPFRFTCPFFRFAPLGSAFATQFCHSLIKRYTLLSGSKVYYMSLFEFWASPLFIEVHFRSRSGSIHHLFHLRWGAGVVTTTLQSDHRRRVMGDMRIADPPPVISSSYKISSLESSLQKISSVSYFMSTFLRRFRQFCPSLIKRQTSLAGSKIYYIGSIWVFEQALCTSKSASKVDLGVSKLMCNFECWNRCFSVASNSFFLSVLRRFRQFCHSLIKRQSSLAGSKIYYIGSILGVWATPLYLQVRFESHSGSLHDDVQLRRLESVLLWYSGFFDRGVTHQAFTELHHLVGRNKICVKNYVEMIYREKNTLFI